MIVLRIISHLLQGNVYSKKDERHQQAQGKEPARRSVWGITMKYPSLMVLYARGKAGSIFVVI
ncbi:MAG: hypothetical protein ACXWT0_15020 [Methylobacter sp.]